MTFEQAGSVGVAGITALQAARQGTRSGRAESVDQRRVRRRRHFRSANCEIPWRRSDRRLQHAKCRSSQIARGGSRDRLHEGRFHQGRSALRRNFRQRAEPHVFRAAARFNSKWHLRSRRPRRSRLAPENVERIAGRLPRR